MMRVIRKTTKLLRAGFALARRGFRRAVLGLDRVARKVVMWPWPHLWKIKRLRPVTGPLAKFAHHHHRITAGAFTFLFVVGVAVPILQGYWESQRYKISASAESILDDPNPNVTKKLQYNPRSDVFEFNADSKNTSDPGENPVEQLQQQVGGGGEGDDQLYSADISKNLEKGVTYYENQMGISFTLTPQFNALQGKNVGGRLVYPVNGMNGQLIYTVQPDGLKEDIVLYEYPGGDQMSVEYRLDLPESLEAKLLDTGEIGLYSADPVLFGQISYGTSDDAAKVEKARNESPKTHLAMKIPAPAVFGQDSTQLDNVKSSFSLSGGMLTVTTTGLSEAEYPLSIDPSVVIDSASKFETGNLESNVELEGDELHRGGLTGGSIDVSGVAATQSLVTGVRDHASAVYNGYIYVTGGSAAVTGYVNNTQYAEINSNGTLGTWTEITGVSSFDNARESHASVAYNGYLYVLGGYNGGFFNDVQYARINSDGSVGDWSATSSFSVARNLLNATVYNGYMYINGGYHATADTACGTVSSNICDDVQFAKINADGTVGTWASTTSMPERRDFHATAIYDGRMYVVGGYNQSGGAAGYTNTVYFAPINADGTVGTWQTTTSFNTGRQQHEITITNGYLYIHGGSSSSTTYLESMEYAPIYDNGHVGEWNSQDTGVAAHSQTLASNNGRIYIIGGREDADTNREAVHRATINDAGEIGGSFTSQDTNTYRRRMPVVVYNGYAYVISGRGAGGGATASVIYASINSDGSLGAWTDTGSNILNPLNPGQGIEYHAATVYNGYIYVAGGSYGGTYMDNVQFASINADGTLGSWAATTSLTSVRREFQMEAYNGYLYVFGGYNSGNRLPYAQYATINSDGTIGDGTPATTWSPEAAHNLPANRGAPAAVVHDGYAYVIGGDQQVGTFYTNTVYYASVNADGSLGTWVLTATLPEAIQNSQAFVHNGNIYVAGGYGATSGDLNTVVFAPINSGGSLGAWQTTQSFGSARWYHGAFAYNGYMYVYGGEDASNNATNTAEYARINNGGRGTVETYSAGNAFPNGRDRHATVVHNGYLYVMGGESSGGTPAYDSVRYAPLNKDGSIGTWGATTNLPEEISLFKAVAHESYMYIVGGKTDTLGATDKVYYKAINADGSLALGSWSATASDLPSVVRDAGVAIYDGRLYVAGGADASGTALANVYFASINSNGNLGSWTTTTSFTTARSSSQLIIYNNYAYIIGGDTGSAYLRDVQYGAIETDGTITAWSYTNALPELTGGHAAVAANGYLYVTGGFRGDSATRRSQTTYAPINANGAIGQWQHTAAFSTERNHHGAVIHNGYLYVVGGQTSIGSTDSIQYASINAQGRQSVYSRQFQVGGTRLSNVELSGFRSSQTEVYVRTAGYDGIYGAAEKLEDIDLTDTNPDVCFDEDQLTPYVMVTVVFNDSDQAVFADSAGLDSRLTSLTVEVEVDHPPTDKRLRHGEWFDGGQRQAFDTCLVREGPDTIDEEEPDPITFSRVQNANADGSSAPTAAFGTAPTEGNLLVATALERSGTDAANFSISGTGWTKRVAHNAQNTLSDYRRTLVVWTKVAGSGEPTNITATVSGGGATKLVTQEFEPGVAGATWTFEAVTSNDTGTGSTSPLSTGTTASVPSTDLLLIGVAGWRNQSGTIGGPPAWTGSLASSIHSEGNTNGRTINSAYTQVDVGGTKSSSVSWSGAGHEASAAILVFSATN